MFERENFNHFSSFNYIPQTTRISIDLYFPKSLENERLNTGTDITTLKKRVAPSTFVEVRLVDRRYPLNNGELRKERTFCTKVDHDTDSPSWNQRFEVKNITSSALQLQLILWEDTKKGAVPTKSKCLGHVAYNLSARMKGGESKSKGGDAGTKPRFMPRIGHGSSNLEHSQIISIPWLHTARISPENRPRRYV